MQAIISGHLGRYAVPAGTKYLVFNVESDEAREIETSQLGYAFADCRDAKTLEVKTVQEARSAAAAAYDADLAVRLFILLFESDDTAEERRELAIDLNKLISSPSVRDTVQYTFYSHPLVATFDVEAAQTAAEGLEDLSATIEDLLGHQEPIRQVRAAFDDIPFSVFGGENELTTARNAAIKTGCFVALAKGVQSANIDPATFNLYQTLSPIPNFRAIVSAWTADFRTGAAARPKFKMVLEPEEKDRPILVGSAARRAFESVIDQQSAIVDKLRRGEVPLARKYASDLIASQRPSSSSADIARSLCKLSKEAQRVSITELQFEWAEQATKEHAEDPLTHGHLADALIALNRLQEASDVLESTSSSAPSFYATGKARILRAQGRLGEAEIAYRAALTKFSDYDDAYHAIGGLAGTLRDLGKLQESLDIYDDGLARFPEEPLLLTGKAATLADLGRFNEARTAYARAAMSHGQDRLVALNGQASIYKAVGDFDRAERAYSEIMKSYEYDTFSRCGMADLKRLQGRHSDALSIYRRVVHNFPFMPLPYLGMAETLNEMNDAPAALEALRQGSLRFPDDARLAISTVSILRRSGKNSEALEEANRVAARHPKSPAVLLEQANALKALCRDDHALRVYDAVMDLAPHNLHALVAKASLLVIAARYDEALASIAGIEVGTQVGWRAEHLRALAALRSGEQQTARQIVEKALGLVKFDKERRAFKSTLASILLKERNAAAAIDALDPPARIDDDVTKVVRLHAYAFIERTAAANAFAESRFVTGNLRLVRDEIGAQLGLLSRESVRPNGWVEDHVQLALIREAA